MESEPQINLKVMLLTWDGPPGIMPTRAHATDVGMDLCCREDFCLRPGQHRVVKIGIATQMPDGWSAVIMDRSSVGAQGVHVLAGVIDSAYRGEWGVVLINLTQTPVHFEAGDRIAQAVFLRVPTLVVERVYSLEASDRNTGGFGSTGR